MDRRSLPTGGRKMRDTMSHVGEEVRNVSQRAEQGLRERGARARDFAEHEWQHARDASSRIAHDNPLATGMLALAAGVGIGLLLPMTEKENRVLGPQRERLFDQARDVAQQARDAAHEITDAAKSTAHDVKQELTNSAS